MESPKLRKQWCFPHSDVTTVIVLTFEQNRDLSLDLNNGFWLTNVTVHLHVFISKQRANYLKDTLSLHVQ